MKHKSIRELLAEQPFFHDLRDSDLDLLAGCGENAHFRAGETIFGTGEPADYFYLIRTGRVSLDIHAPGRADIVISTLGPDEVLGASWLIPPYHWNFDAIAREETGAIRLDATCLRGKCEDDPALGYRLMKSFAQVIVDRLQRVRLQLLDVYGTPAARANG
ncbi:MAG: CRP-like cAMP-activated global transcriptional regulator [Acidimicrobiales bacterium]|nr:MAG: cyclic nucleotide-binding domain-containing protein [Actinomycetota bacterium]MBV6510484.1 CRP-like cAMP-activated global transcriptional regulator [Acidimicrobiales bacterium]RIK07161.1 MAG: Crp/Fnr family transcriptional regulator [Acidobacteriota bacterium]